MHIALSRRVAPCGLAEPEALSHERPLRIAVTAATGEGATPLSAFDAALWGCGVHNYNLIALSSVIPAAAEVSVGGRYHAPPHEWGHRLYVVKAETRSATPGAVLAAGLGWRQWDDGRGVFVEGELAAAGQTVEEVEAALATQLTDTLRDLAARRGQPYAAGDANIRIVSTTVTARPASALVLAIYQARGWGDCRPGDEGDPR